MPRVKTPGCEIIYVEVRRELWEKLKIKAVHKKETLRKVVTDLLEKAVK